MRVLMFGWEFPPHISGGLGTACYGMTRGLAYRDVEVIFVVPKSYGDEDQSSVKLIGASQVPIKRRTYVFTPGKSGETELVSSNLSLEMTYIEVGSKLLPYLSPEEFQRYTHEHLQKNELTIQEIDQSEIAGSAVLAEVVGTLDFTGKYGPDLIQEVSNYALVSSEIAHEQSFDIIHAHDWLTYPAGIAAKRMSGKPLVVHVHATEFDRTGENYNTVVYDIEKSGMEQADLVITVSNLTRNTVINRYGINPDKVVTVYNAVEPGTENSVETITKTVDEKVVTFLGRITYQKGPEYFMEAANKVLKCSNNVRFVMAGSGDLLRKMIRYAARLGITEKFHFTDFLKGQDVDNMFAISDVYVMPSVSEPFGISPLEAMRSNVPVIISKQSGVSEILKNAIKIDFWDVDAMADAIYGLITYESLSLMFRQYGRDEVNNLRWENAALQIKNQYMNLLYPSNSPL
ncbi:MAG: glycosyltransferase family 1 protein [Porphyromonadaceae bacterium]|nr:MAG: glycosyltransferase family 1 protein [Porphyromonadaceae bacterium]